MKIVAKGNFFGQGTSFRTGREYDVTDKFGKVLIKAGRADAVKGSSTPAPATTSAPAKPAQSNPATGEADKGEVVSDDKQNASTDQTASEADKEPTTTGEKTGDQSQDQTPKTDEKKPVENSKSNDKKGK